MSGLRKDNGFVFSSRSEVLSTTTPLASGATYTSDWEQSDAPDVIVTCKTDNTSTLYFDFSDDGVNADSTFPVAGFSVAANIYEFHKALKGPRYFRVRLVNDTGAQTYLRLNVYYGTFGTPNQPLNQSVALDTDALITRPSDFQDEVRIGRRPGISGVTKWGRRTGLTSAAGYQTIWDTTGNYTPPTSADTFNISYTGGGGSNDGAGSTGAILLAITYIDANGDEVTGTHTLGSSGTDTTSFSGFGINRVAVSQTGSAQTNNAVITLTHTTSGNKMAVVPANAGVTNQCFYTMPANADGVAKFIWLNAGKGTGSGNPKLQIRMRIFNRQVATYFDVFNALIDTSADQTIFINEPIGFAFSPTDVAILEVDSDTSNAEIYARFSLNVYRRK